MKQEQADAIDRDNELANAAFEKQTQIAINKSLRKPIHILPTMGSRSGPPLLSQDAPAQIQQMMAEEYDYFMHLLKEFMVDTPELMNLIIKLPGTQILFFYFNILKYLMLYFLFWLLHFNILKYLML